MLEIRHSTPRLLGDGDSASTAARITATHWQTLINRKTKYLIVTFHIHRGEAGVARSVRLTAAYTRASPGRPPESLARVTDHVNLSSWAWSYSNPWDPVTPAVIVRSGVRRPRWIRFTMTSTITPWRHNVCFRRPDSVGAQTARQ